MTDNLRREIRNNVENMFQGRINKSKAEAEEQVKAMLPEFTKIFITQKMIDLAADQELRQFINTTTSLRVVYDVPGTGMYTVDFTLNYAILASRLTYKLDATMYPDLQARIVAAHQNYVTALKDKKELIEQVNQLTAQAVTLKRLVDAWPSALDFVGYDTRARYHEKVVYTKNKSTVELNEAVKVNLLKARMTSDI